jgi:PadR family transcriptional regulator PadR
MDCRDNFKKGSIEMLALKILSERDCYGYEICQLIKQRSAGALTVPEGSLYPALYKLADKHYISSREELVGVRRKRTYYHMEPQAQPYLEELMQAYYEVSGGITAVLNWEDYDDEKK